MAGEKAANNGQNGMQNEIRAAFGQVHVEQDTATQKTPIMSFSNGNVYIGLKLVSTFDQKNNVRREPVPRITASFNGKFVEVPLNGKWWRSFADFVEKMAEAMEGVIFSIPSPHLRRKSQAFFIEKQKILSFLPSKAAYGRVRRRVSLFRT